MSLSGRLSAALARRGVHYGWVVVAATFLTMLVTAGAVGAALGAGVSRTVLATYLPAFFAAGALCLLAAGLALQLGRPGGRAAAAAPFSVRVG